MDLRSFPTEAGDLQGRCQALMHSLTTIIFANCPLLFFATDVEKFSNVLNIFFFNVLNMQALALVFKYDCEIFTNL